jgi:hypothetical protein
MAHASHVCHGRAMRATNSRSGGFFLFLCITGGLVAGVLADNAMAGVLIGTAAGAALALLTWVIDRGRRG